MNSTQLIDTGNSKSFPHDYPITIEQSVDAKILTIIGKNVHETFLKIQDPEQYDLILLELHLECLGEHTGESMGSEGSNILGFARFRMGNDPPSQLIELVKQPHSSENSIQLAKTFFESQQFIVAVCADTPGRIVNRLIRPYLNAVLRRLDDRLATASDMDLTLKLGLGYPEGPLSLLSRSGLADHAHVSEYLFNALGKDTFFPARRAQVATKHHSKK
jgi:3-hydroxybutyryl-CoA dehydrogenase